MYRIVNILGKNHTNKNLHCYCLNLKVNNKFKDYIFVCDSIGNSSNFKSFQISSMKTLTDLNSVAHIERGE